MAKIKTVFTLAASLLVFGISTSTALAATPAQILRDAADGYIDGKYTLAELRAADRAVSANEREYYAWDDAYADAVRRLSNPESPKKPRKPVNINPVDTDGDGVISDAERAAAEQKEAKINARIKAENRRLKAKKKTTKPDSDTDPELDEQQDDDTLAAAAADIDDGSDDSSWGLLAALAALFIVPLAVVGYRSAKGKKGKTSDKKSSKGVADQGVSASSFTAQPGDDQDTKRIPKK